MAADVKVSAWTSDCEAPYCVFQKTIEYVDGTAFAVLEVLIDVDTGDASIVTTAPLGVALEPGVMLRADAQEWRAPLKVCHGDGCRATIDLSSEDFALLLQQPQLELRYIPFGSEQPLAAAIKLDNLVTAISQARP